MRPARWQTWLLLALALTAALCALCVPALAQCAMCRASAAGLDAQGAKQLNVAIVLMVSPPVALFSAFIYLTYKHRRPPGDDDE